MIVSAANYKYKDYCSIFLKSLIKKGGFLPRDIVYFVFDFSEQEDVYYLNCHRMEDFLLWVEGGIVVKIIPFKDMQFVVRLIRSLGVQSCVLDVADCLKGFVYNYIKKPYLWLDSDMMIRKPIKRFYDRLRKINKLAMFLWRPDSQQLGAFFKLPRQSAGDELVWCLEKRGVLNSGLIFMPENYAEQWLDLYQSIASDRSGIVTGECVWNILYWMKKGVRVSGKYNYYEDDMRSSTASILHFAGRKELMLEFTSLIK